jgi:hypothetical protein
MPNVRMRFLSPARDAIQLNTATESASGQYRPIDDSLGMSASPSTPEVLLHVPN